MTEAKQRPPGEPVLRTELGVLWRGCGVAWLEAAPEGSVDLVVADPPYNLGKAAWDRLGTLEDYLEWSARWIEAARRALRPTGSLYVMGFSEVLAHVLARVGGPWRQTRWLVWYYRNKANLRDDWGRSHESILLLRKGKEFTFNTDPVRVPYNRHTTRYPERTQGARSQYGGARKDRWRPHPLGARPRDVFEIPVLANGTREKTAHPTQKPVQLVRRLVLASSNAGDLVVDPFAGSGTTPLVCEGSGRRWAACELEADYVELIRERLLDPGAHAGAQTRESEAEAARRRGRLR
ncbi:MAG: site-specific DNA-methyltransferase [Planctomycetota bacterium]|nr:MAG: site-specific DNA-methyltransferase [Planctomycetota bacterium]